MEKCWYWIINFLYNLNIKWSYKSLVRVWGALCLNMSWCGIDIGSELKCISYCSASWNDSKYQWFASSVCLSLCPSHRESKLESNSILFKESSFIFVLTFVRFEAESEIYPQTEACQTQFDMAFDWLILCYRGLTSWPFDCRTGFFNH